MKKFLKPLVIATSVAAVVGIGAVSFAAWTGNSNDKTAESTNTTGNITMIGFDTATPALTAIDGLLPFDQGSGKVVGSVLLPQFEANENYTITVKVTENTGNLSLYAFVGAEQTSAPTSETETGWIALTTAGGDVVFTSTDITAGDDATTVSDKYLSIILKSSDNEDMNKTFKLEVSLGQAS